MLSSCLKKDEKLNEEISIDKFTANHTEQLITFKKASSSNLSINYNHLNDKPKSKTLDFPNNIQNNQNFVSYQTMAFVNQQMNHDLFNQKANNEIIKSDQINSNQFLVNNKNNDFALNFSTNMANFDSQKKKRFRFSSEEDEKLKQLVQKFGKNNWSIIASLMDGRKPRQCKERYINYLVPGCFKGQWTNDEDDLLVKLYKENGPKWSIIKKHFPNRNTNSLKNRWKYFLSKQENYFKEENQIVKEIEENPNQNECKFIENDDFLKSFDIFSINEDFQLFAQSNDIYNISMF